MMKAQTKDHSISRSIPPVHRDTERPSDRFFDHSRPPLVTDKPALPVRDLWDPWDKRNLPKNK
ncbi:MAG: hypothetical protein HQL73_10640 [Magnetococcales bacterium]|nr:hypothetical protein [Magnetococcales bacterium]